MDDAKESGERYTGLEALAHYLKYYRDRAILPPEEGEFEFPDGTTISHKLMRGLLMSVMDAGKENQK